MNKNAEFHSDFKAVEKVFKTFTKKVISKKYEGNMHFFCVLNFRKKVKFVVPYCASTIILKHL